MMTTLYCEYLTYPERIKADNVGVGTTGVDAFISLLSDMNVYLTEQDIEDNNMTGPEIIESLYSTNGDACDFIYFLRNEKTGEVYIDEDINDEYDEDLVIV